MEEVSRNGLPMGYGLNEVWIEEFEQAMLLCTLINSEVGWILWNDFDFAGKDSNWKLDKTGWITYLIPQT